MRTSALIAIAGVAVLALALGFRHALPQTASPPPLAAVYCQGGAAAAGPATVAQWAQGARLFEGLGDGHRAVTTASPEAQRYFDQGLRLLWAFNHDESTRSFAEAARLDPRCAMCWWGVALTVGPNYNLPFMAASRAGVAREAVLQAQRAAGDGTPVEQALIAALARRYPDARPLDPGNEAPVLQAYADAMRGVAGRFPDDLDVQTLYAESLMNLNAWKLWALDGTPAAGTEAIVALLEAVLAKDPRHAGANHYYVHAVEASPHPERAVAAAERLRGMMPAAGHLEHMPAHIFQRVGRYNESVDVNVKGAAADRAYFAATRAPDYYVMYLGHNYQFLAYSAAMAGRRADTLAATAGSREVMSDETLRAMPGYDWIVAQRYAARLRFGQWDEMLAEPAPDAKLPGLYGGYLYGRAVALAATGRVADAQAAVAELDRLAADTPADYAAGFNSAREMMAMASLVARARIAQAQARPRDALPLLGEAVAREDANAYDEPADWFFPVRHLLGAALLEAGDAPAAEAVYREDLRRHPDNGWSLYGLAQALAAQHKDAESAAARQRFALAWRQADVTLSASAF